jgi:hypothetical protein
MEKKKIAASHVQRQWNLVFFFCASEARFWPKWVFWGLKQPKGVHPGVFDVESRMGSKKIPLGGKKKSRLPMCGTTNTLDFFLRFRGPFLAKGGVLGA